MIRSRTRSSIRPGITVVEQRARVGLVEPPQLELRQARQPVLAARLPHGEHERHRLREKPARDEPERLRGASSSHWKSSTTQKSGRLLGGGGHQPQRRQRDQEAVGRIPGRQAQRDPEGGLLRLGKRVEPVEHRRAQLVQPRIGQLHLRLDAGDLDDPEPRRPLHRVSQERGLADARLAPDDQHGAVPAAHVLEQPIQLRALAGSALQLRQALGSHPGASLTEQTRDSTRDHPGATPGRNAGRCATEGTSAPQRRPM